jgi:hypothetical protein
MLHVCATRFDVILWGEIFLELNTLIIAEKTSSPIKQECQHNWFDSLSMYLKLERVVDAEGAAKTSSPYKNTETGG